MVPIVDEDDIPLTWDPVPVPRPTYTMKAKAERPEVAPAAVTPDPAAGRARERRVVLRRAPGRRSLTRHEPTTRALHPVESREHAADRIRSAACSLPSSRRGGRSVRCRPTSSWAAASVRSSTSAASASAWRSSPGSSTSSGVLALPGGTSCLALGAVEQVVADGVDDGDRRHRDETTDDAGEDDARRDREDDGQRVDAHHPSDEERLEQVGLDLLHTDDDAEHDQRLHRAPGPRGPAAPRRCRTRPRRPPG